MVYISNSKPKGPKKPSGVVGFLGNLIDDVGETATGIIPGLWHIGSAVAHDAGKVVGLTNGQFQTDDIANTIKRAYTDDGTFWKELLADGDVKNAWKAFYDNPLGPALDVASLFTLGAGTAARGAGLAGKMARTGGTTQARLNRFAGLDANGARLTRTIDAPGVGSYQRTLSQNPLVRARQNAFENLSDAVSPDRAILGKNRRVARRNRRIERVVDGRQEAKELNPVRQAIAKLNKNERRAVHVAAGGHRLEDEIAFRAKRLADMEAELLRRKQRGGKGDEIVVPGQRELPAASTSRELVKYDPAVAGRVDTGTSLALRENGTASRTSVADELAYEEAGFEGLLEADSRVSMRELNRNIARTKNRMELLQQVQRSGVLDNPSARFQNAVAAVRGLSAETTQRMIQMGKQSTEGELRRMSMESELMRLAGVTDETYAGAIRSHTIVRPDKIDNKHNRATQFSKPGEVDAFKRTTGYSYWNALDEIDPSMYLHAARQVFQYQQRFRRFKGLLDNAVWMRADDAARAEANGWKSIEAGGKLRRDIDVTFATLVDADDIFAGLPGYDDIIRSVEASLIRPDGSTDAIPMMPKSAYDELVGEFNQAHKFIRMWVDRPTRIWRALTLNLRPAWIVNNYVGQMLLLAVAYGVRGLKEYVTQFSLPGRAAKKYDAFNDLAPELSDFGWAHEAHLGVHDLQGNKVTRGMRRASDFMGNLNQRLTDDHTRRAAFMAELGPHVKRYQKANPDADFETAAKALWNDAEFADEVTRRVLDNMIDFTDLSNFERSIVKRAIPFYAWIRGISKRTARLVGDEPWKAAIGANIGQYGIQKNEEMYGQLPEFLQGIIGRGGNTVAVTQGLNPFMTPADVTGMIGGTAVPGQMVGPQNPLATLNPIIKAPFEAAANMDFFYGRPITDPKYDEPTSFGQRLGKQGLGSLAQWRVVQEAQQQAAADRGELEYDPLFEPSLRNAMLAYLGIPVRTLDIDDARERAASES